MTSSVAAAKPHTGNTRNVVPLENLVVHYALSVRRLCLIAVALPSLALIVCFVSAAIFQADAVHETHCKVYNIVPSISAVTGVSPQRYLWRLTVALHVGPRIIIAIVNRAYHLNQIKVYTDTKCRDMAFFWTNLAYWLNVVEICSLCGVTYVSNLENYFVHEKFFVIFIVSSLLHMISCIQVSQWASAADGTPLNRRTLLIKESLLGVSLISTAGVIIFFLKHRLLCHDMAFSWFACFEYILAFANMAFHTAIVMDFPTEYLIAGNCMECTDEASNGKTKKLK